MAKSKSAKARIGKVQRKTSETQIDLVLNIDGTGQARVKTGIPFLDHMLTLFARHGLFDLQLTAKGDLDIDLHHTNEDIGIALGQAFKAALGDKKGIRRYGFFTAPMDETLVRVSCDLSGRPSLFFDPSAASAIQTSKDHYHLDDAEHLIHAFVIHSGTNLHIDVLKSGKDIHHVLEGIFKTWTKALDMATQIDSRVAGVPSTKGVL